MPVAGQHARRTCHCLCGAARPLARRPCTTYLCPDHPRAPDPGCVNTAAGLRQLTGTGSTPIYATPCATQPTGASVTTCEAFNYTGKPLHELTPRLQSMLRLAFNRQYRCRAASPAEAEQGAGHQARSSPARPPSARCLIDSPPAGIKAWNACADGLCWRKVSSLGAGGTTGWVRESSGIQMMSAAACNRECKGGRGAWSC